MHYCSVLYHTLCVNKQTIGFYSQIVKNPVSPILPPCFFF